MARFQKALAQLMRQDETGVPRREDDPERGLTIVSELRTRVSAEEFALVSPFAKVFLRNARLLDGAMSTSDLAALALGACRFLCDRHSLPFALRTYRPTVAEHGWESTHQVIEIATADQAALVNSICDVVEQQRGATIEVLISAVVGVDRDATGLVQSIHPDGGASDECLTHIEVAGVANPTDLENVLRRHLSVLVQAHREAGPLRDELQHLVARLRTGGDEDREVADFLTWLDDGRMNLIGYQELGPADAAAPTARGVFANPSVETGSRWDGAGGDAVAFVKMRAGDPTRPGEFLDEIRIRPTPVPGEPDAYRLAGTFTTQAFRDSTSGIPLARRIWAAVVDDETGGAPMIEPHVAQRVFDRLPIDLVLATPQRGIGELVRIVHGADTQATFRAHVSPGRSPDAGCWVTIVVPRKDFSRNEADNLAQIVRDRLAPILARHVLSDELSVVRLHYALDTPCEGVRPESLEEVTAQVRKLLSSWRDRPVIDGARVSPAPASVDAHFVRDENLEIDGVQIELADQSLRRFLVRAASGREPGVLNRLLRTLDHLGLQAVDHSSRPGAEGKDVHQFVVEPGVDGAFDAANLSATFASIEAGSVEDDVLNSLSGRTGASARSIEVLRAFCALAEFRGTADRATLHRVLADHSDAGAALLHAFEVKFDPRSPSAGESQRKRDYVAARERFEEILRRADDARARAALRDLAILLDRSLRTSFYCGDRAQPGRPIALKLEHPDADRSPFETFVYGVDFEGFLWRTALTARSTLRVSHDIGALRSSASDDLARQMVRASCASTDPGVAGFALRREGPGEIDRAFESFLGVLFDVMDNFEDGAFRRDSAIVAYDEADPYLSLLVEERPTGFADLARRTIHDRGFWMGDAAVTRYDHRVAAEGAWSGLQAILPSRSSNAVPRTVVALGSPHDLHLPPGLRLLAAIDADEIYIDPASNPKDVSEAVSKLSGQARCSWSDLPTGARGRGSAVLSRDARSIELSDEARAMLGEPLQVESGEDLIRAILAIDADLLWVRGAHVRVVSTDECGRHPGGVVEIDASRLGARAVAEAGHEVFSTKARVQFAFGGGILLSSATDSLVADLIADRVANVDLALRISGSAVDRVEIPAAELAAEIRGAAMVASRRHILSMALDERRSRDDWASFAGAIRSMRERSGTPAFDSDLPSDAELEHRQGKMAGLTRPEIAIVHASVRHHLRASLRFSALAQDPYLRPWIDDYFPSSISGPFTDLIDRHPLRYEIGALGLIDRFVNTMGCSFAAAAAETAGRSEVEIVKAWCAAFVCGGAGEVLADLDAAGVTPGAPDDQRHRLELDRALRRAALRLVDLQPSEVSLERMIDRFGGGVGEILRGWPELLPDSGRAAHEADVELGVRSGLSSTAAEHLARIRHLGEIIDICDLAVQINSSRSAVAMAFLGLDPVLRFAEIDGVIESLARKDVQWGARAAAHLWTRLATAHRNLTAEVVAGSGGRRHPVARFVDANASDIDAFLGVLGEARAHGDPSIAAVEVLLANLETLSRKQRRAW